jgi:7-carboxy-7-deazaguanine synthase
MTRCVEPPLEVNELFVSIAGESTQMGRTAVFLRLSGCNLRCRWCDTQKSWVSGKKVNLHDLVERILGCFPALVVITGGEPLLQPAVVSLCKELLDAKKQVMVETNGSVDISVLPPSVTVVLDMKAPSSGQSRRMDFENLQRLADADELKFVIADRQDYLWSMGVLQKYPLAERVHVLFSPVSEKLNPSVLASWLLVDRQDYRIQIQLHRMIWPDGGDGIALPL